MILKNIRIREKDEIVKVTISSKLNGKSTSIIMCNLFLLLMLSRLVLEMNIIIFLLFVTTLISLFTVLNKERFIVDSSHLTISRKILMLTYHSNQYELEYLRNMYIKKIKRADYFTRKKFNTKYDYMHSITFEYQDNTYEYAKGIDFKEGKALIRHVFSNYSLRS